MIRKWDRVRDKSSAKWKVKEVKAREKERERVKVERSYKKKNAMGRKNKWMNRSDIEQSRKEEKKNYEKSVPRNCHWLRPKLVLNCTAQWLKKNDTRNNNKYMQIPTQELHVLIAKGKRIMFCVLFLFSEEKRNRVYKCRCYFWRIFD